MKDFSFFEQAYKLSKRPQSDNLGFVSSISRQDFAERETFTFTSCGAGVEYACLLIENALLLRTDRGGRIYAGFEKMSKMQPIVDRYLRIADVSESVFIFGEPDWTPPRHPNIRLIRLKPDCRLTREWFLIADSSTLQVAVIARDDDNQKLPMSAGRCFSALKTSNSADVTRLANAAEGVIDWSMAA